MGSGAELTNVRDKQNKESPIGLSTIKTELVKWKKYTVIGKQGEFSFHLTMSLKYLLISIC